MVHVVIPVRPGIKNVKLKYALRALEHFHGEDPSGLEATVIGSRPDFFTGRVIHTKQIEGATHQWSRNFRLALDAIVQCVEGEFLFSHDDIFLLRELPDPIPTFCRSQDIDKYVDHWKSRDLTSQRYVKGFVEGMESQRDVIRALGLDTQHNADGHFPHLMRSERVAELLRILDEQFPDHPSGHFRMIYGALWPGDVVRTRDPKVSRGSGDPPGRRGDMPYFVSTSQASWSGSTGRYLRQRFIRPSRFERHPGRTIHQDTSERKALSARIHRQREADPEGKDFDREVVW